MMETTNGTVYSDGFGGGWLWVFFLFFLLAWGGNGFGFGGNSAMAQGALTRAELYEGLNNNNVVRKLDGLGDGICNLGYTTLSNFKDLQAEVSSCCCTTNRNIDAVRYENARNTCDIVRAIEKDGDATRALINANVTQALRDKIVEKDQQIQTRDFQLSQQAQNAYLVNKLQPTPQPAYITCSPYQSSLLALNALGGFNNGYGNYNYGYGYNDGYGCCRG